ncbi:MAG TPA: hypothetical protein VGM82_01520 [Gemmatimonadaceae bacterium]
MSATVAAAQDSVKVAPKLGRILGLFDAENGEPLEGADVVDRLSGSSWRTLKSGLIGLAGVQTQHDSAVISIRKIGYADTTLLVMMGIRDTSPVQLFLRHVTALDSVVITAHETEHLPLYLHDFEQRLIDSKATGAKTIGPLEMRKNDGRRLYDLLLSKGITNSGRCNRVGVYLNGAPYRPPTVVRGSPGIPDESVDDYDAVVFYTGAEMPAEFRRTGGGCAALLLYSRGR